MRRLRLQYASGERGEFLLFDQDRNEHVAKLKFDNGSPRRYHLTMPDGEQRSGTDLHALLRTGFGESVDIFLL